MTPQEWFDRLTVELGGVAFDLTEDEVAAVLDLARIAAHGSERWTAPVTTFLVGLTLAQTAADDRAAHVQRLVDVLERVA